MSVLEPKLREHLALYLRVYNLLGLAVEKSLATKGPVTPSKKVATALLLRLANDLRCSVLLAVRGYGAQACSLCASIYEAAFTIAAIGPDDAMARKWIKHTDPTRQFLNSLEMAKLAMRKFGVSNADAAAGQYVQYQQFCFAKHLNPQYVQSRAFTDRVGSMALSSGPDVSENGERDASFALEHGTGFGFLAIYSFVQNQTSSPISNDLVNELKAIENELLSLKANAAKRWGIDNPFPDKWKIREPGKRSKRRSDSD